MKLPATLPLFPLPNAVLFPGVPLPLHIFEPRYRAMVRDVEQRDGRLVGMVLLRGDWRREYYGAPDVFPVGCAGRMVNVEPLPDGRYNILLHGLREFRIVGERRDQPFREATVEWRADATTGLSSELRTRTHALLQRFLEDEQPKLVRLLNDSSISDELLINFLCYAVDFAPVEKQALLEAPDLASRAIRLCEAVQFALEAKGRGGDTTKWCH
jgi:Lon protease-like protein